MHLCFESEYNTRKLTTLKRYREYINNSKMNFFLDIRMLKLILLLRASNHKGYRGFTQKHPNRRILNEQIRTDRSNRNRQWIDKSPGRRRVECSNIEHYIRTYEKGQSHIGWIWHIFNVRSRCSYRKEPTHWRGNSNSGYYSTEVQSRERTQSSYQNVRYLPVRNTKDSEHSVFAVFFYTGQLCIS